MKKGFTLVELLAVIVILAVILVIAVPQVLKVVDNSRISAYLKNKQMVLKAVDLYVSRNTESLPGEIGDTTEISVNYLVSNGMLTEIKNPYNKNEDCTGYVIIMKLSDKEYDYTPHLRCGLNIHDSTDDGLVLHYKFDDFQEPTENIIINGDFGNNFINWANIDSSVIELIEDPTSPITSGKVIKASNPGVAWNTVRQNNLGLEVGKTYTLSYWVKHSTNVNQATRFFVYVKAWDKTPNNNVLPVMSNNFDGVWRRIQKTFVAEYENYYINVESAPGSTGDSYITGIAIEEKLYTTPFVNETRYGIVTDYSGNQNHAELSMENTPRWVYDRNRNGGVYEFNGINNYILIPADESLAIGGDLTIIAWIKRENLSRRDIILEKDYNKEYMFRVDLNNKLHVYQGNGNYESLYGNNIITIGEWFKVAYIRDTEKKEVRFFINGLLDNSITYSRDVIVGDNPVLIGKREQQNQFMKGSLDDIRIYNRALSEQEIKLLAVLDKLCKLKNTVF